MKHTVRNVRINLESFGEGSWHVAIQWNLDDVRLDSND